ncbi:glycosyltransferase family 4 protein [Arenicella xantha]|uniref:Glycosyltransferase involved in cell wall biosynthesis n=1 Tax=Arenicella xantha TaxID=644221 RepID=A0A395JNH6_9GAMM|nr:glycosyltransferase family 4 protein [Arenicella xantha]RBP49624.1 glycosyltransferase involved in cell wall biosynthesis [Arenicella xantha]
MAKKINILHIAPTPFFSDRGCHIRIEGIVRCLSNLGYENTVCTYHHGRDVATVDTRRITPIKNYTQTAAGPSKYKLWADWKLLWLTVSECRRAKPRAIHAHLHEGLMIGFIVKLLFFWRGIRLIADMQGSLVGELDAHGSFKKRPYLRWPTHLIERGLMWSADAIICSSSHSLEKIQSEFSIPHSKISLAQDGADHSAPLDPRRRKQLVELYELPSDKPIIVYSGALLDSKGLQELKDVIVGCQKVAALHWLIIGYPTGSLRLFLREHGLESSCTLTGQVDFETLPNLLRLADIAIDPKLSNAGEGSGKMLNYLASGLAVAAFDTQNNREFLPTGTPLAASSKDMVKLLLKLSSRAKIVEQLAANNFQHFEQHYSWSVTQRQLDQVYTSQLAEAQ